MGRIKAKLGLRGKTKPGEMISRMNEIKNEANKPKPTTDGKKVQ